MPHWKYEGYILYLQITFLQLWKNKFHWMLEISIFYCFQLMVELESGRDGAHVLKNVVPELKPELDHVITQLPQMEDLTVQKV